jgi:hypothetical protein
MLPVPVVVALTLLREVLRALAMPAHAVLYLLRREAAQRRARELLAHWQTADQTDALATFLQRHPPRRPAAPHVFLSAGEPSGEAHAARLLAALHAMAGVPLRCSAFGGDAVRAAGATVLVPLSQHAIMGVLGVLKSVPFILATFTRFMPGRRGGWRATAAASTPAWRSCRSSRRSSAARACRANTSATPCSTTSRSTTSTGLGSPS